MNFKQLFLFSVLLSLLYSKAHAQQGSHQPLNLDSLRLQAEKVKAANKVRAAGMHFQYFVIKGKNNTYGYDVYADGAIYLHQPTIPAVAGAVGFADTLSAGKTARLVIKKIKEGEVPPTISVEELRKMGVVHTNK